MIEITIEQVEEKIKELYLLDDEGIIRIILATILGNRINLSDKPIWLLILSGSSSGKTAMMSIVDKCGDWIVPVDTLTTNTFASAMTKDQEVSLLWKANNGIFIFKDFTTITTMNEEGLREIMGQLRAIYDGEFTKRTGNANDVEWRGKVGIIAGGTIASQRKMRQFSEQGERFINYIMDVADAKEITKKAMDNQQNLSIKVNEVAELVAKFINQKIDSITDEHLIIPDSIKDAMIHVADFATKARSPVTMSKKDPTMVEFVGDREMPPRMAMMLVNIAKALMIIAGETTLSELNARILYKTALDSVPVERRMVLSILTKYREASTIALAQRLNYPTNTMRGWCNQLNALQMTKRSGATGGPKGDTWKLKDEYKDVICKYENIKPIDEPLKQSGDSDNYAEGTYHAYMELEDMTEDQLLEKTNFSFNDFVDEMSTPESKDQKLL